MAEAETRKTEEPAAMMDSRFDPIGPQGSTVSRCLKEQEATVRMAIGEGLKAAL